MSIILQDSFNDYNGVTTAPGLNANYVTFDGINSTTSLIAAPAGRNGQMVRQANSNSVLFSNGYIQRGFTASNEVCLHQVIRISTWPQGDATAHMITFLSGTTYQVGLQFSTLGEVIIRRASGALAGTELGRTAHNVIFHNAVHFIKLYLKIGTANGAVQLYVDGNLVIDLSAVDTQNHASVSTVSQIRWGIADDSVEAGVANDFGEYYISNGAILPEATHDILSPTSDVVQGFSRSSGATNYTLVDENPVSTADYVTSNVIGTVDTYGVENLANTPKSILAVILTAVAAKTDAGDRALALQSISGATTTDSSSFGLGTSQLHYRHLMETNPDTAAAWTKAEVDALQAGPKVAS